MGSFSVWHLLVLFLILIPNLMFVPALRKTGFSGWWIIVSFVPLVGLVALWVWAYAKWPAEPGR